MESVNEKDFVVFSQQMAGWLMYKKCKLLKMKPSKENERKFVYYFPNIDFVKHYVDEYMSMKK